MRIPVVRKDTRFEPDPSRVIARYFFNGEERALKVINRVVDLDDDMATRTLHEVLRDFAIRHRNITRIFEKHFGYVRHLFDSLKIDPDDIPVVKQHLIGAYFTLEYSIESAAFFNPCIIPDPDQEGLEEGDFRFILSFRATGEGHISSMAFRRGVIKANGDFMFPPVGRKVGEAEIIRQHAYDKARFLRILDEIHVDDEAVDTVTRKLGERFTYQELKNVIDELLSSRIDPDRRKGVQEIMWLADSHYEIIFSYDTDISERIIFPVSPMESKGVEDARFVRFEEDDGSINHYATYTAYDGRIILPKLIQTRDFYHFRVLPLHGYCAQNKNLALFPRKINGSYVMLSRNDGVNNYIMFSQQLTVWNDAILLQEPEQPWQFVQIGNCGSPIETDKGWLLFTHGVGPMRQYCIGATLLDLNNPAKVIGTLDEPLLVPDPEEREGYVPNVVYSCGAIIHNGEVIIPYGLSDYASSMVTVKLSYLLDRLSGKSSG